MFFEDDGQQANEQVRHCLCLVCFLCLRGQHGLYLVCLSPAVVAKTLPLPCGRQDQFVDMCKQRADAGYNSGMGEIFRKVAAISPIQVQSNGVLTPFSCLLLRFHGGVSLPFRGRNSRPFLCLSFLQCWPRGVPLPAGSLTHRVLASTDAEQRVWRTGRRRRCGERSLTRVVLSAAFQWPFTAASLPFNHVFSCRVGRGGQRVGRGAVRAC